MTKPITLMDVKVALRDQRFRDTLPPSYADDIKKYLDKPGCGCNTPLYRKILSECKDQLAKYFPGRPLSSIEAEVKKLAENHWSVINCHIDGLEDELKKLPPGRKQLAIARHLDQVTVVVNNLDVVY